MKKLLVSLSLLLMGMLLYCVYIYTNVNGTLQMKAVTAGCFVVIGCLGLLHTALRKGRLAAPVTLLLGLLFAMAGDLTLSKNSSSVPGFSQGGMCSTPWQCTSGSAFPGWTHFGPA